MKSEKGRTIIIHKKRTNFTLVPNEIFADKQLSWKAKGILCYLIGRPDTWLLRISDLSNHSSVDKEASIRSALKELRRAGYVKLEALRKSGKITIWTWHISDQPIFKDDNILTNNKLTASPDSDFQQVAKSQVAKSQVANHPISNTDSLAILIDSNTDVYKNVFPSNPSDIEGNHFLRSNRQSVRIIGDYETEECTDDGE